MTPVAPAIQEESEVTLDRGQVGMVALLITETSLFAVFVVAYVFYMGKSLKGPLPKDVLTLPVWATVCLLSSSITIEFAVRALRRSIMSAFRIWLGGTILLGLEFLHRTAVEWNKLINVDHLTIKTNLFGTTFYALVGLHATHVVVGVSLLLVVLLVGLRGKAIEPHHRQVEFVSWYWHFVDAVWIVVFLTVYVLGR
jgi:cytochrome c oxidase subunit 3/cytochrome o ubiquinol oxidase subunit 3